MQNLDYDYHNEKHTSLLALARLTEIWTGSCLNESDVRKQQPLTTQLGNHPYARAARKKHMNSYNGDPKWNRASQTHQL
jgi:hypothetical protein